MNTISFRIAAAMLPALVLLLALFGVATAVREGEVLEEEMQRDADAVAVVAAALLAEVPLDRGVAVLEELDHPRLRLEVHADAPRDPADDAQVWASAPVDGGALGWVVVTESLADRDTFVRRALATDALGVLVSTLVAGVFAVAVGRTLVQARVVRVMDRLDAVARDEFPDAPLALGQDELGQLGVAVDSMTRELQLTRNRAAEELAARRRAQLQLRRADRLALVGRTVAVFAHEVGNPLSVIVGRAERIVRRCPDAASDGRVVLDQAERITSFVQRLLDYSRHDDGFELVPSPLGPLVDQAVQLVSERGRQREVAVAAELGDPSWRADVDPQAMVQVVTNLLANAIDASPEGGRVVVAVSLGGCDAERGLDPDHLHVAVTDQGEGIPEAIRARVLDPFFTTKEAGEGTGLGLSIVAEIVADHGGFLTLETGETGGCRAVVHLPCAGGARG